jgi:hypothetical protein
MHVHRDCIAKIGKVRCTGKDSFPARIGNPGKFAFFPKFCFMVFLKQIPRMTRCIYAWMFLVAVAFVGCGVETPESVAQKWCGLQAEIDQAEGEARDKLRDKQREYETSIENRYEENDTFIDRVKELTKECGH